MANVELRSLQCVFFVNNFNLTDKLKIASGLVEACSQVLDGDPAILPIPDDAPVDIPRIIVRSKSEVYVCQLATSRIDFFYNPKAQSDQSLEAAREAYLDALLKLAGFVRGVLKVSIVRFATVANCVSKLSTSSNQFIRTKYLKDTSTVRDTYEIQLHALNKLDLPNGVKVNRWYRVISSRDPNNLTDDSFLTITVDINSLSEIAYDFDERRVQETFLESVNHTGLLLNEMLG